MIRTMGSIVCLTALLWAIPAAAQQDRPGLSLHDAIRTALENSPSLGAAVHRNEAGKAAADKASALPNPELSVEAENIGGDGPYEGFDSAEVTYGVSQLVEMPGKRSGRADMARGEEQKTLYERDATRLDLIRDVLIAYAETVAAEAEEKILAEERSLAADVLKSVSAKVDAGKEPPIQKNKAAIALSSSEITLERAERSVQTAHTVLAGLIASPDRNLTVVAETLPKMTAPQAISAYADMVKSSPDVLLYDANIQSAQSGLGLEKAGMVPDPTINVGVRDFREDKEQAFVAGLSIPFPVFDMNRAGVRRAGHEYNAAMLEKAKAMSAWESDLARSYEAYSNAYREHQVLTDKILPGAEEAFSVARQGYAAGKFGYLEVLDAQRTLFEARKQSVQTMLDYYREMAVIDRLTARHAITNKEKTE